MKASSSIIVLKPNRGDARGLKTRWSHVAVAIQERKDERSVRYLWETMSIRFVSRRYSTMHTHFNA